MIDGLSPIAFDMALMAPVHTMIQRGFRIDEPARDDFREEYEENWEVSQQKLNRLVGYELNVNSPKAVGEFLYDELGLPERRYAGSRTTRETALRALMAKCDEERKRVSNEEKLMMWLRGYMSILFVIKIRGLRKRISSYINAKLDEDGRMRSSISVGGTEAGRFSSSKTLWDTGCNLQTIPPELRSMFIADPGKEIAEFDLRQSHSWIYAHLSEDPELLRIHREGLDFHAETASTISYAFAAEPLTADEINKLIVKGDQSAKKLRFLGKKINHASAYQMGPITAAEQVNKEADSTHITITPAQAKVAQRLWRERYFGIPEWWKQIQRQASRDRTLTTPYGRSRTFFERWGESLFKEMTAYVPLSTEADYINSGMLRVYNELELKGRYGFELLHQNHDSIVTQYYASCRPDVIPHVSKLLRSTVMVNGHEVSIPIEASYGPSWGELTKWAPDEDV